MSTRIARNSAGAGEVLQQIPGTKRGGRRTFLKMLAGGGGIIAATSLAGCDSNDMDDEEGVNLGSGDIGILNYAYALEQLEAAFYTQVTATFYANATDDEKTILSDIRDHEIAHRDFLKAALGTMAIANLAVDFSSVNFNDRNSVLTTAQTFEDLGVAAYNGAGQLLTDANHLAAAGSIVSVEARHASAIRDLLAPLTNAFVGPGADDGLDDAKSPSEVLAAAGAYIKTQINASNLPTT